MTKLVNIKNSKYDVYIGRPTIFGNPYKIGDYTREESIQKYKELFYKQLNNKWFKDAVLAIKDTTLGCFCSPLPCHGDIIVEYLDRTCPECNGYGGIIDNSINNGIGNDGCPIMMECPTCHPKDDINE